MPESTLLQLISTSKHDANEQTTTFIRTQTPKKTVNPQMSRAYYFCVKANHQAKATAIMHDIASRAFSIKPGRPCFPT